VRDDLVFRRLDEEWVVYDPKTEQLHVLNRTAAAVWACLTGDATVAEIVETMHQGYGDKAPRRVEDDVRGAIASFAEKGLLA
jgi:PqqD family protein of HPr-rel-A system